MPDSTAERTFVLGLDGVPWKLLSSWAEHGNLPHFNELFETGASGPLESTMPPTTALAWPSITTGVRPDKHGIYSFRRLTESYTHEMNTSNDIRQPTLWDIVSPSVVANVPMTYPAREIDGKMVTGMMTPSMDDGFTHPTELANEIKEKIPNYKIGLSWHEYHDREQQFLEDLSSLLAARRELMRHLMGTEEWELFFFVYTEPDRLKHLFWDKDVILEHYKELDDILGEVMEFVSKNNANLFVVSDHGFGPISESVHVNTILEQEGYLCPKSTNGTRGIFEQLGITKSRVRGLLQTLHLEKPLVSILPKPIVNEAANQIPGDHSLYDIEFSDTGAFCHGYGNIFINDTVRFDDGSILPENREETKHEIKELLQSVEHPQTGESVLIVRDGKELFPTDPDAPDLVVKGNSDSEVKTSLSKSIIVDSDHKAGSHRSQGVFLAWGPNVEADTQVAGADVYDIIPTLLHSRLKPIPGKVDGRVLDIFKSSSEPATTKPATKQYQSGESTAENNDFEDVEERLRGLGYLN